MHILKVIFFDSCKTLLYWSVLGGCEHKPTHLSLAFTSALAGLQGFAMLMSGRGFVVVMWHPADDQMMFTASHLGEGGLAIHTLLFINDLYGINVD